jgi:hypothetical protein
VVASDWREAMQLIGQTQPTDQLVLPSQIRAAALRTRIKLSRGDDKDIEDTLNPVLPEDNMIIPAENCLPKTGDVVASDWREAMQLISQTQPTDQLVLPSQIKAAALCNKIELSGGDKYIEDTLNPVLPHYSQTEENDSCCFKTKEKFLRILRQSKLLNYILEYDEYSNPCKHGWRIRNRRIFLMVGTIGFTYVSIDNFLKAWNYSSKLEIQELLDRFGTNITWPDEGSSLDDLLNLYSQTQKNKSYAMVVATILFITSVMLDTISFFASNTVCKKVTLLHQINTQKYILY